MTATPTAPHRDNLLGVCAALGEDFGFDPLYLRIALAIGMMADAKLVLIGYATAGLLVLASRLIVRPRRARPATVETIQAAPAPDYHEPLPLAA